MKQYFKYDDPPIDSPTQRNSTGNPPEDNQESLQNLLTIEEIELADGILPNNSQNVITNHIEDLEKINPLPELTKSMQLKQKTKRSQDKDNHFSINTLPNCVFNRGKQSATHSVEKETSSNDHTLPDYGFKRGKQSVTHSREENDFPSSHDQQKARNEHISNNTSQTLTNENDLYLVEEVKKYRHRNGKLEFLIKWLSYSNRQNAWEPEDHLSPVLVQEYFQHSSPKKPTRTNKIFMT